MGESTNEGFLGNYLTNELNILEIWVKYKYEK